MLLVTRCPYFIGIITITLLTTLPDSMCAGFVRKRGCAGYPRELNLGSPWYEQNKTQPGQLAQDKRQRTILFWVFTANINKQGNYLPEKLTPGQLYRWIINPGQLH